MPDTRRCNVDRVLIDSGLIDMIRTPEGAMCSGGLQSNVCRVCSATGFEAVQTLAFRGQKAAVCMPSACLPRE